MTILRLAAVVLAMVAVVSTASLTTNSPKVMRLQRVRSDILHRINTKRLGGSGSNMNVNGSVWPVSIYWTTIQVGTPPVDYAVCIDSGSNALFLSGKGCKGCVTTPPNVAYDPSGSATSKPLGTTFNFSYTTCNPAVPTESCQIKGSMYSDVVSVAGYGPAPIHVGAIQTQTSNFYQFQTINGIIGLGGGPVSGNVFQTLCVFNENGTTYKNNVCHDPRWSICFHEGTRSNGTLTFGGVDERLADGPITYVPSNTYNGAMPNAVTVSTVSFGGIKVPTTKGNALAFLDTGTNDVILPETLYDSATEALCGPSSSPSNLPMCRDLFVSGKCVVLTEAQIDSYPNVVFHLDRGVQLTMTGRDYLLYNSPAATAPNQVCLGFGKGGPGFFIFGDTIMRSQYLVFGMDQVGFAKVNRNTCGSI